MCVLTIYHPCSFCDIINFSTDDYTTVSVELTFSPGSPRNCKDIPITDDIVLEGAETLFANLTTSDSVVILAPNVTEIILDDSMYRVI